jgi:acyl dehydratase
MKKKKNLKVGKIIKHWPGKTITENDNNLFCLLTMNHHPIHLDKIFSKKSKFKKQIIVGTYVFSIVVGMTVRDISIIVVANLGYDHIKHLKPVFIGDTIYATSKIISERRSKSKKKQRIIGIETYAKNQKNEKVIIFKRHILV